MAGAGSTARIDIKDLVDIEANLPDLGADRSRSQGVQSRSRVWRNLTKEGSVQEARHDNETQLKSEDTILNRTRNGNVYVRVVDDVAETGATTRVRRVRNGVVMSHSGQV